MLYDMHTSGKVPSSFNSGVHRIWGPLHDSEHPCASLLTTPSLSIFKCLNTLSIPHGWNWNCPAALIFKRGQSNEWTVPHKSTDFNLFEKTPSLNCYTSRVKGKLCTMEKKGSGEGTRWGRNRQFTQKPSLEEIWQTDVCELIEESSSLRGPKLGERRTIYGELPKQARIHKSYTLIATPHPQLNKHWMRVCLSAFIKGTGVKSV